MKLIKLLLSVAIMATTSLHAVAQTSAALAGPRIGEQSRDLEADRLLNAVVTRLRNAQSLSVQSIAGSKGLEAGESSQWVYCQMARPHYYTVESVYKNEDGETRRMNGYSDGHQVGNISYWPAPLAYTRPLRPENFYHNSNPIVFYFFNSVIEFDPADPVWQRSVSIFDTNKDAYNRSVTTRYLGERALNGERVKVVEVNFNTERQLVRQTFYIKGDLIVTLQTSTLAVNGSERVTTTHFRNYQFDVALGPERFRYKIPGTVARQDSDPVRLGEIAPDFTLPTNSGGEITLKDVLNSKKAVLVVGIDGGTGAWSCKGPDWYLAQMKLMQEIRDKFENQGLEVVAVVGGTLVTPKNKQKVLDAWMPDQTRFSYPIAVDLDLEKGMQGSAFHNFQLNGRNNILLDQQGRVVFACENFDRNKINELALYQALAQIGFAVSPADLELKEERGR